VEQPVMNHTAGVALVALLMGVVNVLSPLMRGPRMVRQPVILAAEDAETGAETTQAPPKRKLSVVSDGLSPDSP